MAKQKRTEGRKCLRCGVPIENHNGRNTLFCTVACQILQRCGNTDQPDACWPWLGPVGGAKNVAQISVRCEDGSRPKSMRVARAMYIATHGAAEPGLDVFEACGTRHCCNPKHLSLRRHEENCLNGLPVLTSRRAKSRKVA